jgi:hypothetical protein
MFNHHNCAEAVEDFLFGPSIEELQRQIDPDPMSRLCGQLTCSHLRRDWLRGMCRDCGVTDDQVQRVA